MFYLLFGTDITITGALVFPFVDVPREPTLALQLPDSAGLALITVVTNHRALL